MLSAQGRDPSAARESVGRLAVTTTEQIFSFAWNSVKERLRLICGSLELSDGPLRTSVDLYLPRIVSFTPASRLPAALHQSALCAINGHWGDTRRSGAFVCGRGVHAVRRDRQPE